MEEEKQQEVRRVVERLLDGADMEAMTGAKVRNMVASQTGLNPHNPHLKKLVNQLIDAFLQRLNEQEDEEQEAKVSDDAPAQCKEDEEEGSEGEVEEGAEEVPKKKARQDFEGGGGVEPTNTKKKVKPQALERDEDGNVIVCQLSAKRNLAVQDWKGKTLVSIREYYEKDGKMMPSSKGISLTAEQWESLKNGIPSIEKAIKSLV